jgi:hypothetical protein
MDRTASVKGDSDKPSVELPPSTFNPICGRFPQMKLCGCTIPCRQALPEVQIDAIRPGSLYIGPLQVTLPPTLSLALSLTLFDSLWLSFPDTLLAL